MEDQFKINKIYKVDAVQRPLTYKVFADTEDEAIHKIYDYIESGKTKHSEDILLDYAPKTTNNKFEPVLDGVSVDFGDGKIISIQKNGKIQISTDNFDEVVFIHEDKIDIESMNNCTMDVINNDTQTSMDDTMSLTNISINMIEDDDESLIKTPEEGIKLLVKNWFSDWRNFYSIYWYNGKLWSAYWNNEDNNYLDICEDGHRDAVCTIKAPKELNALPSNILHNRERFAEYVEEYNKKHDLVDSKSVLTDFERFAYEFYSNPENYYNQFYYNGDYTYYYADYDPYNNKDYIDIRSCISSDVVLNIPVPEIFKKMPAECFQNRLKFEEYLKENSDE
jgi:hypothetical protein